MIRQFLISYSRPALLLGLLVAAASVARAQGPGNNGSTGGPPAPSSATAVPLDAGASLLLASGVALGIRHLRRRRKRA